MNRPRHLVLTARLALAWLVLTLGVATASPWVSPQTMQFVCSDLGQIKLVVAGDEPGDAAQAAHPTLDCPACLSFLAHANPAVPVLPRLLPELMPVPSPAASAPVRSLARAPLPPRGPPQRA
ncbi:hypothetical protein P3G55_22640 [Leptospira sp. 96542]|nr:hypothetical protein [Leptospira sp. 96542]